MSSKCYKPGDTITDGYSTYAVRNSGRIDYISSGNHAAYRVNGLELSKLILRNNLFKPLTDGFKTWNLIFKGRLPGEE